MLVGAKEKERDITYNLFNLFLKSAENFPAKNLSNQAGY
jgi:hypothetical protein